MDSTPDHFYQGTQEIRVWWFFEKGMVGVYLLFAICVCVVLRIEPRTLCMLGQCFTTELYLYPELRNIQEVKCDNHEFETSLGSIMRCWVFCLFVF